MRFLIFVLLVSSIGRAEDSIEFKKLDKVSKKVKIFRKSDVPNNCEEMDQIKSLDIRTLNRLAHEQMLQREASEKGANAIQIVGGYDEGYTAIMFKCKSEPETKR